MKTNEILTPEAIHSAMCSSTEGYVSLIVDSLEFELQRELTPDEEQAIFRYVEGFIVEAPYIVLPVATLPAGAKCISCGNDTPEYIKTCPHCDAEKCNACDMGDDTRCMNCEGEDV